MGTGKDVTVCPMQGLIRPSVGWLVSHGVGFSSSKKVPCHPSAGPRDSLLILPSGWKEGVAPAQPQALFWSLLLVPRLRVGSAELLPLLAPPRPCPQGLLSGPRS